MKGTIAGCLDRVIKSSNAFTLQVVFCGKVKPVEFALYHVFDDGLRMAPFGTDEEPKLYPLTAIQSIEIDWIDEEPEGQSA